VIQVSTEAPSIQNNSLAATTDASSVLGGNSATNLQTNQPTTSASPMQQLRGIELKVGKYDRVYGVTYVPAAADHFIPETTCVWWAAGECL
jgi:hypothetical protein